MQDLITAADIGREPNESDTESIDAFTPSEAWIKHYQKQATPALITGLNQFARTRALAVADAGRKVDDYYARELVLDALGDTWLGVVRWDPTKCTLAYHIVRTIEGRADKHRKHAMQRPHDAIDDTTDEARTAERDASERCGDTEDQITRMRACETMTRIRMQSAKDLPVIRILDAYDAGCTSKDEVLAHARMKNRTYHNAYGRLRRIVRNLTDHTLVAKARA